jgi:hypothetical protein
MSLAVTAVAVMLFSTVDAHAACVNKFVSKSEGNKRVVTLLTGEMTFAEASELARRIAGKDASPVEWIDERGKQVATSLEFSAVRPMPVACGEKASGAVLSATFVSIQAPTKSIRMKFSDGMSVSFEEQGR